MGRGRLMSEIYVCRHGQTDMNLRGILQGRTDTKLNDEGRRQADAAGDFMRKNGILIDEVLTSPLSRAVESAEIMTGIPRENFTFEHALIERGFGAWEGKSISELPEKEQLIYETTTEAMELPGAETIDELMERVKRYLTKLKSFSLLRDRNILLSTHGAVMHAFKCYLYDIPKEMFWSFSIRNCELMKMDIEKRTLLTVFPGFKGRTG